MLKKQIYWALSLTVLGIGILGCSTYPRRIEPTQKSNLTYGSVKGNIVKGETTQAEILELFGAPNIITKNRDDDEVWNYNKMSYKALSGSDAGGFIFWGGSRAMVTTTTKSFDLILIFDKTDVVNNYSIISASF